jgi:hypothetical protein
MRRPAAFSSSPLALLAASSSALRYIHLATNLCTEFLARHTSVVCPSSKQGMMLPIWEDVLPNVSDEEIRAAAERVVAAMEGGG